MALNDLFGSRDIPFEIAEHIFRLAGPEALTSVRCTCKANAEAYSGVALSLVKRGLWRGRVDSLELLELAVEHRLRCLRVIPVNIQDSLPRIATLDWLRELYIYNHNHGRLRPVTNIVLPPRLVVLELKNLRLMVLPPLPDATLERLVWYEHSANSAGICRTGPLPSSLLHFQCNSNSFLVPPVLPPLLQHLDLDGCFFTTGVLPTLPATLKYLSCRNCYLMHLPDELPPSLVHLNCASNRIAALPGAQLPPNLTHLDCASNILRRLPDLPHTLQHLECQKQQRSMEELPALHDTALEYLDCSDNRLTSLPNLPESLISLYCHKNPFTEEAKTMIRRSKARNSGL